MAKNSFQRGDTRPAGLFITASGTEVGKTYVAEQIARTLLRQGLRVGVYKPVASGCHREGEALIADDAVRLWRAAGCPATLEAVCPQRFEAPLAPNVAARLEGRAVDEERMLRGADFWFETCDVTLVEGAGGLLSPLSNAMDNAELALRLSLPAIIVVPNRLGAINLARLTLSAAERLEVVAIVLNETADEPDPSAASNFAEIRRFCPQATLVRLGRHGSGFSPELDFGRLAGVHGPCTGARSVFK